jgi:glyoxylase I family protein
MTAFPPLGHIAITVVSCDSSSPWYEALFGSAPVLDEDTGPFRHVVWALPGGSMIGLHEHPGKTDHADSFSEFRVGLDHIGFHCASRSELETWVTHLDELGYRHGGIVDAQYGSGLSFRDPDGNALEFFAPPNS